MDKIVRVHNKGVRAIPYERSFRGVKVIHPGKTVELPEDQAKSVIDRFDDAVRDEKNDPIRRGRASKETEKEAD